MSRFNSLKIEAKEIYELTLYLSDEEYETLNYLINKTEFKCSQVLRMLLREPLLVEQKQVEWRSLIVPFRRLLGVYSQLCNLINEKAPIYEKLNEHRYKLCEADEKIHRIFISDYWSEFLKSKNNEKSKG